MRFLTGIFFSPEGFAINDFEAIPIGEVTDLTVGLTTSGDCSWADTNIWDRLN